MFCSHCNISCRDKYSFQKHCKSAKHLINSIDHTVGFDCEYCGKKYQYKQSMKFHQKKCKEYLKSVSTQTNGNSDLSTLDKKQLIERINQLEKDAKMQKLESENESLKQKLKIAELEKKTTNNNTTNNIDNSSTNNTTNNITNITINAFGYENDDYITKKFLVECVKDGYNGVPNLIKKLHNDPNHPENHNIKITDKRLKEIKVMGENGEWLTKDRKETVEQRVYDLARIIYDTYKDNMKLFPTIKQERFERYNEKLIDENEPNAALKTVANKTDNAIIDFKKSRRK